VFAAALAALVWSAGVPAPGIAQPVPPDSTAPAPAPAATQPPTPPLDTQPGSAAGGQPGAKPESRRVTSTFTRTSEEIDRFELGAGVVRGFFDGVGSFGYRRFLGEGPMFEQSIMAELTGTGKKQLTEGALGVYLLFRPVKTYRESWRLRPLVEAGPGVHAVFQAASLQGLNKTRYKSQVYIKTHLYVGFEALITSKWGLVVRGRGSAPSHRPLDYAQAAIFLR